MGGRVAIVALAAVAVVIAFASRGGGDNPRGASPAPAAGAPGALRVSFVYSPEKEALVAPLVRRFNEERNTSGGRVVEVRPDVVASGVATDRIGSGALRPVVWSPASSLWGRLVNHRVHRSYAAAREPSLVRTPLVIAMWEPLARALGWPRQHVGFAQILRLATSPNGWAAYGRPEFGAFKLGHTNPDFSTSGLSAVAAEYYAARGKREGLTVADVERRDVRRRIRRVERSIVHYGDTTLFFADQMRRLGTAYASAVAMEEVTLLDFNRRRRGTRLVALYPEDGTFYSDNPLIVMRAPWVSSRQAAAGRVFTAWLRRHVTPAVAARGGFRPGDPSVRPAAPISRENGADPHQPTRVLALPQPPVLDRIRRAWREDRKPANIMLVVDTSGSMGEEDKLRQAQRGLQGFLDELSPSDRVGLIRFSSKPRLIDPIAPSGETRDRLGRDVAQMQPDGETALYDATLDALARVRRLHDTHRINAVVVLSDGVDTTSNATSMDVVEPLRARSENEGVTVRVFTIAYGSAGTSAVLEDIAEASGGKHFAGDPREIQQVYQSIASFF
jgi:Ca-activated chloride channel homolog